MAAAPESIGETSKPLTDGCVQGRTLGWSPGHQAAPRSTGVLAATLVKCLLLLLSPLPLKQGPHRHRCQTLWQKTRLHQEARHAPKLRTALPRFGNHTAVPQTQEVPQENPSNPTKTTSPPRLQAPKQCMPNNCHKRTQPTEARPVHRLTQSRGAGAAGTAAGAMCEAAPLPCCCPAVSNKRLRGVRCSSCNAAA